VFAGIPNLASRTVGKKRQPIVREASELELVPVTDVTQRHEAKENPQTKARSILAAVARYRLSAPAAVLAACGVWALQKPLHVAACALLMVFGVMAYKWKRWWLAALLTMLVGLGWEIAQMTVEGHNPRLADLAPDFLGVVLGWLIVESLRYALKPDDHIFG
jgi:Flp pilus assembly protein TadB